MAAKRSSTVRPRGRPKPFRARGKAKAGGARSLSDPLARAQALADRGDVFESLRAAQTALAANPRHWRARHLVSRLLWNTGRQDEAVAMLESAVESAPPAAEIQIDLATSLLGMAYKAQVRLAEAIEIGQRTIARHGPDARLFNTLIQALDCAGRLVEAVKTADAAIALFPAFLALHSNKSLPLLHMGKLEEAVEAYAGELLPLGSNPGKPADELRQHYQSLAAAYDDNTLHQSFSERMARFVFGHVGSTLNKRVLDAGCGTGLLATRLKAARLVGIDQSPEMLAKARARGIYSELVEGDLVQEMAARTDRFDLVVSACVLYHIADLAAFFREAARLLDTGGRLFFSVDPATDAFDIARSFSGEFAHSRAYLRRLAAETGFAEAAIRIMPHRSYPGFWCAFRREV